MCKKDLISNNLVAKNKTTNLIFGHSLGYLTCALDILIENASHFKYVFFKTFLTI
jgi:predicted alpha/beta superfamily hydrolase